MSPVRMAAFEDPPKSQEEQLKDAIRAALEGRSKDQLLAMAGALIGQQAASVLDSDAPKTKDELWHYIKDTWGYEISRVAVCAEHDAPFDFIWLGYAEIVPNLFCIGPRSGGKSFDTALLMELNSRFKPGCESMVFGAVDDQNKKVYDDMVEHFINGGLPEGETEIVGEPKISETNYKNGSRARSYPATVAKMNGQHPPKAHAEEVEIMRESAYKESRNMATDKIVAGRRIKAQNFGTSTRKKKNGRVDKIFQAFIAAKNRALQYLGAGATPEQVRDHVAMTSPWYCLIYCTFEISQQVPNCRSAPENRGRPEEELCKCHMIENGIWDNGEVRRLDQVCGGKWHRSRGHRSHEENIQLFLQNDRATYEAQQLCGDAESEGLYIKSFSRNRNGLSKFALDPNNGPCYTGTDWGTTDAAAVLYVQYAARPVQAIGYGGQPVIVKKGDRIVFAEVYEEGKTSGELGQAAIIKEHKLANVLSMSRLPIKKRWADLQGAGDRRTWSKMGLKTSRYSTRNFDEHVKEMRGLSDAGRLWVVVDYDDFTGMGCPQFVDQIESWGADEDGKEDRSIPQHLCAAGRYVLYGMHDTYNDPGALLPKDVEAAISGSKPAPTAPAARVREVEKPTFSGDRPPQESWMAQFGPMSTAPM